MASSKDDLIFCTKIVDNQTGRDVNSSSLVNFQLAGWENFQDSRYTSTNKLLLPQNTLTKITFTQPVLFPQFSRQPQIGSKKYPIWDFDKQRIQSYNENNLGNCSIRLQFVAEAQTNATGVSVDGSLFIPNNLTIYRETHPIAKGNSPQRVLFNMNLYYDQNTIDNGVEIYLRAIGDNINIYNISAYIKNW